MRRRSTAIGAGRRQLRLRRVTIWIGMLCVAAQLLSASHVLLVEHVLCAEHGELVHADNLHGHGLQTHRLSTVPAVSGADAAGQHDHDVCFTCCEPPRAARVVVSPATFTTAQADDGPLRSGLKWPRNLGFVYSFAPKTSPPA